MEHVLSEVADELTSRKDKQIRHDKTVLGQSQRLSINRNKHPNQVSTSGHFALTRHRCVVVASFIVKLCVTHYVTRDHGEFCSFVLLERCAKNLC